MSRKPRIGIALGSGAARGWAHIGVLKALSEMGIQPAIICGSSMGALIGASYCLGKLDVLEDWCSQLTRAGIIRFLDVKGFRSSGLLQGQRLMRYLEEHIGDQEIDQLSERFACVATDIETGREIWLKQGSVLQQVRASIALPGLFTPHHLHGQWLVDGGLVNPVPVSLCRAMGAEVIIAVDVNGGLLKRTSKKQEAPSLAQKAMSTIGLDRHEAIRKLLESDKDQPPGAFEIMVNSMNIMQERITRSRLAGEPPEVLLHPKLNKIGLLEFERGKEAIEEGQACVKRAASYLQEATEEM